MQYSLPQDYLILCISVLIFIEIWNTLHIEDCKNHSESVLKSIKAPFRES